MEKTLRLIWISMTSGPDGAERRILEVLADFRPLIINAPDAFQSFGFQDEDLVVINAPAMLDPESLIERVRAQTPGIRMLVRSILSEKRLEQVRKFVSIDLLDEEEGPELTRARLLCAMAPDRIPSIAVAQVPEWRRQLIGRSAALLRVVEMIRLVGPRRCTVLITGETGTGKEIVARAIHRSGPRASKPFVALNCSAVPAPLLEAELFGHTKGAFTGAIQVRVGRFEQAQGGTLFLDEIGDLPLELQAKLLRVLQEREFQKLGSSETIRVDARVVAATNCDLQAKVADDSFREDLFYRLNVVPLALPPLRARASDVRPLAEHFLAKICEEEQIPSKQLTPQAWAALEQYEWPGNVRQLENAVASAVILSGSRVYLDPDDFPRPMAPTPLDRSVSGPIAMPDLGLDFTKTVNALERNLLAQALRKTGGNKKAAAEMLRLKRTTLSAKVRVLDVGEYVA